jgi:hypothetical protein
MEKHLSIILFFALSIGCSQERSLEVYFENQATAGFPFYVQTDILDDVSGDVLLLSRNGNENGFYGQKSDDKTLVFLLDENAEAGETRIYTYRTTGEGVPEHIQFDKEAGSITFSSNGEKTILQYHTQEKLPEGVQDFYKRSGFIHPFYSPSGLELTDDFPVGHVHQHGIFAAWVNTTFKGEHVDFWNQQAQTGTVRLDSIIQVEDGPVFGRLKTIHSYVSTEFGEVLREQWDLKVFELGEAFLLDLSISQSNIREDTLYLNDYIYGGLAFRGNAAWNREDSINYRSDIRFLTAEGRNREEGNHTRPGWVAAYGELQGGNGGIAILDYKENIYYPQPVRIHPEMPYFCMAPIVNNPLHIPPGGSYHARYWLLSFDGQPQAAFIESAALSLNY